MKLAYKYFDIAARGETIRILLHLTKVNDWKDDRVSFADWPAIKPLTPLGQIPTLTVEDTEFCQSVAILRYLANVAGLYPKDDPFKALIVDEALDVMSECMVKNPQQGTPEEKKIARQVFQKDVMTKYFGLVESRIQQFGGERKDSICGEPSVADFNLMTWVETIRSGFFDGIDTDFFDNYPGITTCAASTADRADVKAYYASLGKGTSAGAPAPVLPKHSA